MADNDIEIKVKVDAQGTISVFDKLGNEISKLETKAKNADDIFNRFGNTAVRINQGLELLSKGFNFVVGGVEKLSELASLGDQINDVGGAFEQLSIEAGAVGDVFLNKLQDATLSSVDNLSLMKLANDALLSGLNPDQFTKVAGAAKQYGDTLGLDTSTAINKLSEAIQNGNEKQLKQFGIYSDGKERVKEYTQNMADLGKQVDAATIADIKRTAALEALNKKQVEQSNAILGVGDTLDQVKTSYTNLTQKAASAFDANTDLAGSLSTLKEVLDKVNAKQLGDSLSTLAKTLANLATVVLPIAVKWVNEFADGLDVLFGKTKQADVKRLTALINDLKESVKGAEIRDGYAPSAASRAELEKYERELDVATRTLERLQTELKVTADENDAAAQAAADHAKILAALKDKSDTAALAVGGMSKEMKAAAKEAEAFAKKLEEDLATAIGAVGQALVTNGDISGAVVNLGSAAGSIIGNGIKDSIGQSITDVFGAGGATLGGPVGTMIGSILGSRIGDDINKALSGDIENAVKDALALPTGGLSYLIPSSLFGGDSEGTQMRKAADKFFADAFDKNRLQVVIGGQLQEIKDLVFSGNQEGGLFGGLSQSAQGAFAGIGTAFEGLLGIAGDLGVNIGNVFANNLGGSLNNLQLLVQASGVSFEQLGDTITQSFLKGELAASKANEALEAIKRISEKGIPDGVGLTTVALENAFAAGSKGGAALVDAFQDIGAEAGELNIKTFPDLMANLAASGKFSTEQISAVFNELQAVGIDTVDKLTNATANQLIPVFAKLEQQGFLTEAAQQAQDLVNALNELPTEKDVVINVRTNVSDADRAVIAKIEDGGRPGGNGNGQQHGT